MSDLHSSSRPNLDRMALYDAASSGRSEASMCMHYDGDAALVRAAGSLGLCPGQRLLDIGSGFCASGRMLHRAYGVSVVGIEVQAHLHRAAQEYTARAGMQAHVVSVHGSILDASSALKGPFDAALALLSILHIPQRAALFARLVGLLRPGGRVVIEDYYELSALTEAERRLLREQVACPRLPGRAAYLQDLREAGLLPEEVEDLTEPWRSWTRQRALAARGSAPAALQGFYDTVADLFAGGRLGGMRIVAASP